MSSWEVVYKSAYNDDGTLWFPERLSHEFLAQQRKDLGSYIFANQYLNEVIPKDDMVFKPEWKKYYKFIPKLTHTFAIIDPAISLEDGADYTALIIFKADAEDNWYVTHAKRFKITPTEIINLLFNVYEEHQPMMIGIESVAFQKALIYMAHSEMQKRGKMIPIAEIKPETTKTKEMRILSLIPRFEWGKIFFAQGLNDLEDEIDKFPRAKHDDLLDAISMGSKIVIKPTLPRRMNEIRNPSDPAYERDYIKKLGTGRKPTGDYSDDY